MVFVTPQEGAPLQLISTWIDSSKAQSFRLVAQFQNQSAKAIRVYAFKSQTATIKLQNSHVQFMNLTQRSAIWQPSEMRTVEFADSQEEEVKTVRLTLDFVEFSDGSTWGPDSENSRDMLAGQREGAKLERQRQSQIMRAKGQQGLISDAQVPDRGVERAGSNRSAQWLEGFRQGQASMYRAKVYGAKQADLGRWAYDVWLLSAQ